MNVNINKLHINAFLLSYLALIYVATIIKTNNND